MRQRIAIFFRQGLQTLGELWKMLAHCAEGIWKTVNSRSVAQSSSSFPALIFARHIAGVQPQVGSRGLVRLAPSLVVKSVHTRAYGIDIEWDRSRDRWDLTAQFPRPAAVELVLPFARGHLRSLAINGTIGSRTP